MIDPLEDPRSLVEVLGDEMDAIQEPRSDGSALDVWDNLPPHLQEALREALEGLSEAFEDVSHPLSSHLQRLWDVTDEIEAYILAREKEVSAPRE